jgi:hypothetical protein
MAHDGHARDVYSVTVNEGSASMLGLAPARHAREREALRRRRRPALAQRLGSARTRLVGRD